MGRRIAGEGLVGLQPLVVGVIFLGAGAWKVFSPRAGEVAARSGRALVFRDEATARRVHRLLGLAELDLGLLLLWPHTLGWEIRCASALATAFVGYAVFSMRAAPDQPYGCLGGREARASRRTLGRAVLLLLSTLLAGSTSQHGRMRLLARFLQRPAAVRSGSHPQGLQSAGAAGAPGSPRPTAEAPAAECRKG